jgi:pyridoxamine 5'-phosphate oxidase
MACSAGASKPKPLGVAETDPFQLFAHWFAEARSSEPNDPEAMSLATATPDGRPSVRMVLLKDHGPGGFTFFTNLDSRKGAELSANSHAALLFHWKSLRRQVRIEGAVETVSDADADAYFATRARDSQLGAWASWQSRPLDSRATFERRFEEMNNRFDGGAVPRPPRWSGFRLKPELFEFWSDRPHRLHERRLFTRTTGGWHEGLLYP